MPKLWRVDVLAETSRGKCNVEPSAVSVGVSRSHTAKEESAPPDIRLMVVSVVSTEYHRKRLLSALESVNCYATDA